MPRQILVVDDDPDLLRLIEFELEREGLDVIGAPDGESARRKLEESRPSTIVLDLGLTAVGHANNGPGHEQGRIRA